ncbi:MAG: tetratricopeptide repeat protein [Gammaproteobacteria bacterium]|nr:tetratricopeptide repeat protein [Gammaproteobacteria bacterium]MBV8405579.1 tetratricopeptide repeat protein [Gammaproteobacteria bacterium]
MAEIPPVLLENMRRISELLRAGNLRSAQEQLAAIVEAQPHFVEGLRLLAGTQQALGDPVAAETLLRRALALDPNWTPTLATLGELLLMSGRGAEAEPLLQRALTGSQPFPRAALLLARYYNDSGRAADALAVAAPLALSGRADAELAAQHVAALAALGRAQEAVATYQRIVAARPDDAAVGHALATALNMTGQHEQAIRVAQELLTRGPRNAPLLYTYARSLIAQGTLGPAETALRECLSLEPRFADAHSHLAQLVWLRSGDLGQATAELDRALQTFSSDEALWATRASILQGGGNSRGAYECLAPWALRAQAPPALLLRAGLAALEFDAGIALDLAERALRRVPENGAARTLAAAAQLGVGNAAAALDECQTLLARTPDDQYLIALETTAWRMLGDGRYAQLCDYRNLVVPWELEPPAPWQDLAAFLADLRTSLNRLHDPNGHALLFQSLRNGTETTQDLSRSSDPVIKALFGAFAGPIRQYIEFLGPGSDPLRRRNNGRWRFNGSWSVRLHSAGYHANHTHPRGWISSACYIELPDCLSDAQSDEGILSFGEPGIPTRPALGAEYSVRPQAGMLVLFPSYLWHGTVPFRSTQARLTVAFDAVPER